MKQFLITLLLVLLLSFSFVKQQTKAEDIREWNRFELTGIVKTLKEKTYKANFTSKSIKEDELSILNTVIVSFDSIGRYTKSITLNPDNNKTSSTITKYTKAKNYESFHYSKDNVLRNKSVIKYVSDSLILEESFAPNGELLFSIRVEKQNDRFSKVTLVNGDKIDSHFYYYTDDKFINNIVTLNKNKDTISHIKYKYLAFDKNGNWTKRLSKNYFNKNDIGKLEVREISY
ncbi:hypothetical protein [Cellulophaga lytica]|uniref:Uncharacterized protein n=1 Tax=Cellulophaga lytica (strain ATCC 23178 / DSM 7489 / JCM 8516 / NBRC 14961 / NCIMB 1423 / VKM B-1433 / Cy l20) TaxID=867900 RepID=F0RFV0_CELLC|nr:hypothetical protein [Cellulophaga lytica]ADY30075.1 hypothetical protein Celly_2255 [Cellulophaga lytica DSM 7489]AIM61070.1 hypothetical protein IX49_11250 [Cellulophaga lytica]APU10934.1 hypothetical protein A5M85_11755 [Cellulophaga lytica]WQG75762.1 hypothetical protein SR888_08680 [Cellulophaga lytica]